MNLNRHVLGWSVAVLTAAIWAQPARAQTPLDLSQAGGATASGAIWLVKDVGTDTSLGNAATSFTGATTANGWKAVDIPADLGTTTGTGDVADNTYFWYRLDGLKIPADWPKDRYLILTGFNVDDSDVTFFNGTEIGATGGAGTTRTYVVPPELVNFGGANSIAIQGDQVSGAAGITSAGPMLQPGPSDTGIVVVKATNPATGKPVPNVLVTTTAADGTDVDTLTNGSGQILYQGLAAGAFPIQINSYPWVGTTAPVGTQNITIAAGKFSTLNLTVTPFVYTVTRTAAPIPIDGNINGPAWSGAVPMSINQKKQSLAVMVAGFTWAGPDDLSATAKWMWDDTYIYLAADVTDDHRVNTHVATPTDGNMWQGDSLETYIQLDPYSRTRGAYMNDRDFQWTIGVAPDDTFNWKIYQSGTDNLPPVIPDPTGNVLVTTKKTGKPGYTIEARFPWSSLPNVNMTLIPPKVGTQGAIAMAINDTDTADSPSREKQLSWNTKGDMYTNPSSFTPSIWGDVAAAGLILGNPSGSGKIGIADATLVLQFVVKLKTPTGPQATASDVDKDGDISIKDVTKILQAIVNGTSFQ